MRMKWIHILSLLACVLLLTGTALADAPAFGDDDADLDLEDSIFDTPAMPVTVRDAEMTAEGTAVTITADLRSNSKALTAMAAFYDSGRLVHTAFAPVAALADLDLQLDVTAAFDTCRVFLVDTTAAMMPQSEAIVLEKAAEAMTYEAYLAMNGAEQQAYMESFDSVADFFVWYNAAKAEYEAAQDRIEIGSGGSIDLGNLIK